MKTFIAQAATGVDIKTKLFGDTHAISKYADEEETIGGYISSILPTVYIVAGFILFLYAVFGGFMLISSAGNSKKAEDSKQVLTNAIIGFAVIFTSYWIIQIIEVITGIPIL